MAISGKVTYPDDLQPAIDALGKQGRFRLEQLKKENENKLEPWMIAKAADFERLHG